MKYNKICVIGCAGSGKSYFSKKIAEITGLPCYHIDLLFWKPNWISTPREEFLAIIDDIVKKEEWIIDGNYGSTMELRFQNAQVVYFLDMPAELCLESEKNRRGQERTDFPDFLEEREDPEFLEFIRNFNNRDRNRIMALIQKYPLLEIVSFTSREEVKYYLEHFSKYN